MSNTFSQQQEKVKICFFDYECWKCTAANHVYYAYWINNEYSDSQDFADDPGCNDTLWSGKGLVFRPDIVEAVKKYLRSSNGKNLRLGAIKSRYSQAVGESYVCFGCYKCDVIFGDAHIMDATLEARY